MATHYDTLGVAPTASLDEIRRAYHRLARRHHPDVQAGTSDDGQAMEALNEAWAVLRDPARRRTYDDELGLARRGEPAEPEERRDQDVDGVFAGWGEEDEGVAPARSPADHLVMVPVVLFGASVVCFAVSMVSLAPGLWIVAAALLPVAAASFVATPLLVLRRARRVARGGERR